MATGAVPILVRSEVGRVVLDLRSVFPRHDSAIVAELLGDSGEETPLRRAAESVDDSSRNIAL
jgi:hypothetical protein